KPWLFFIFHIAYLHHRAKPTQAGYYRFARFRILAQFTFPFHPAGMLHSMFYILMKRLVEFIYHFIPLHLAIGYFIKLLFYLGRETIIHYTLEVFTQEIGHHHSQICRE